MLAYTIVYAVLAMFPAFECTGERCPSNDHANGDWNYTPHAHSDGGYALKHRWLGR